MMETIPVPKINHDLRATSDLFHYMSLKKIVLSNLPTCLCKTNNPNRSSSEICLSPKHVHDRSTDAPHLWTSNHRDSPQNYLVVCALSMKGQRICREREAGSKAPRHHLDRQTPTKAQLGAQRPYSVKWPGGVSQRQSRTATPYKPRLKMAEPSATFVASSPGVIPGRQPGREKLRRREK